MTATIRSYLDVLAADGRIVQIRPVRPDDASGLLALYERESDESLRLRFFTAGRGALHCEVDRLVRPAGPDHVALAADDAGELVGVASYEREPGTDRAEFAVIVDDRHHGRGIGTLLLEHLAGYARRQGIRQLTGDVLAENAAMLRVARDLVTTRLAAPQAGVVEVRVPTDLDEAALAAVDARERVAGHRSLVPLLAPRSIAVIGAGRKPGGIGHEVLRSIIEHGFTGSVHPVNAHATEVAGVAAYPTVAAIPERVDLAVVAVPATAVREVVAECATAGVRAMVILTSGLGETDAAGRAEQSELVRIARRHGMRLVGPNCLGVLNTDPQVRLAATFAADVPPPGGLAVASQSGAVGIAVLDHAARTGIGISSFVSLGNKADVSGNDLLTYWYDDPDTEAVALYLESFGNPRKFARIARALARRKPVLAVKSGRSEGGRRAGASHTAAAAAPDVAVDSLFAQAGVIRTDTLGELLDAARMMVGQPLPTGNRVAVVGNAGGANVLAADAADAAGLTVPQLSPATVARLREVAPDAPGDGNPVDLGAATTPRRLQQAVRVLAGSGEVDSVLTVFAATRTNDVPGALTALAEAADQTTGTPFAVVLLGVPDPPTTLGARKVPVYPLPELAVRALGHAVGYARWRREPLGRRLDLTGVDSGRARALVDQALATGGGWQPAETVSALLHCYGVPAVRSISAGSASDAVAAAEELGYPVAVKSDDPDVVHKSDIGAVHLGLTTPDEVRNAYRAIGEAVGVSRSAVVVQPMARGDVELVAGVVHDPLFGSLVMLGLGGVHTDLLGDRTFRLLPVTDIDANRMWRSLRAAPLLTGYRGKSAVDTRALEDLLLRVGRLAEDIPEIAELDLNPVLAGPDGLFAVDAKLRLSEVGAEPDAVLRALRMPG
ncbi:MAG TPA: GNAT family N-acetyltransferase [Micromonosporaceae bacterium]